MTRTDDDPRYCRRCLHYIAHGVDIKGKDKYDISYQFCTEECRDGFEVGQALLDPMARIAAWIESDVRKGPFKKIIIIPDDEPEP